MQKYSVFYKGEELEGYSMDGKGSVYGPSGKMLSVHNGKVIIAMIDGKGSKKRKKIALSELVSNKPAFTVDDIMSKTSLEWYSDIEDVVERATEVIDTGSMSTLPLAVLDDIVTDGVVPEDQITDEIAGIYTIRYINDIIENGFEFSRALAYDDDDEALFAVFGTNGVDAINEVMQSSANLHLGYMQFLRNTITHIDQVYGVKLQAVDLVDALSLSTLGITTMRKIFREVMNA